MLKNMDAISTSSIVIGLVGDVMIGRGIDNILPNHCHPKIYESYMKSAKSYVDIAENANGPLPYDEILKKKEYYIWGNLKETVFNTLDLFIINLETTLTLSESYIPKGINYRCHPKNVKALKGLLIKNQENHEHEEEEDTIVTLANNHIFDWDYQGFKDTLKTLNDANILYAGVGNSLKEACQPIQKKFIIKNKNNDISNKQKDEEEEMLIQIGAAGSPTAGVPETWAATPSRFGLQYISDLSIHNAQLIARNYFLQQQEETLETDIPIEEASGGAAASQDGDVENKMTVKEKGKKKKVINILSLHWGSNWGWGLEKGMQKFAHTLLDNGIDVVFGHSSHHIKGIEIYQNKIIFYGCGDFLNDYEGIDFNTQFTSRFQYRSDLTCLYRLKFSSQNGSLEQVDIIPCEIKHLKVQQTNNLQDIEWIRETLNREGRPLGTWVEKVKDPLSNMDILQLRW